MRFVFKRLIAISIFCGLLTCSILFGQSIPVESFQTDSSGITLKMNIGKMRIEICTEDIIHVMYTPFVNLPEQVVPVVNREWSSVPFKVESDEKLIILKTRSLEIRLNQRTGSVGFYDSSGIPILREPENGGKSLTPDTVSGTMTWQPEQVFISSTGESFYGLGQFPEGEMDWKNVPMQLHQANTQIVLPFLLSNKGYGLLWNNPSLTDFNPTDRIIITDQKTGEGKFTSGVEGEYGFIIKGGEGVKGRMSLEVDGKTIINVRAPSGFGRIKLDANKEYKVVLRGKTYRFGLNTVNNPKVDPDTKHPDNPNVRVYILPPTDTFAFKSEMGMAINYYFMYGPEPGRILTNYSLATGAAPLFSEWAYGFWQSRQWYTSQEQILEAAAEFRKRKIPVDVMVQDARYWGKYGWNAMKFDEQFYPKPDSMIAKLHEQQLKVLISVWSRFGEKTDIYNDMRDRSLLVENTKWFDAFNPQARSLYWSEMNNNLFKLGIDGWWLDATEPEHDILRGRPTYKGIGNLVRNAYPFNATRAVYEGQRKTDPTKRVCILSRSAFVGTQRYAAACWSGDIRGDWETYRRQIPNGLNLCMAGMPYWTTDIGGFFRPVDQHTSSEYHELLIRWIQYGAFCPIFRIHGGGETEVWKFGPEVLKIFLKYDKLRYRLIPYIYSLAWKVTDEGYTIMRALPLDFPKDTNVARIKDQFMFGPAFLVNPVIQSGVNSRELYLPDNSSWYDFWSGNEVKGGKVISAAAPLETLPLYIRSGSIITMGPDIQYTREKYDPIEIRVYPGSNGAFTLYQDEGDGYGYEKGFYATIPIQWNDATNTLIIGKRQGDFPGMPKELKFYIVRVKKDHGVSITTTSLPDKVVMYSGESISFNLK